MPPSTKPTTARKLEALADGIERTGFANTTRLTVVKKWLNQPVRLKATALFIAKRILASSAACTNDRERELWVRSMDLFANTDPSADRLDHDEATALHEQLVDFQNEHRYDRWGAIRIIESTGLLIIERAIGIILEPDRPDSGYKLIADHLGSYEPMHGPGLYPGCVKEMRSLAHFVSSMEAR